ncbi:MAG: ferrous iron transport protein A [Clostridia bacterium]|nr:ferrous iron transport protein A [Clostridia bacterium]
MKTLDTVKLNDTVIINTLNCTGKLHRRFLDLGIIPGTKITPIFSSIFNDPVAYEVRGSVIALRHEDSEKIVVL